MACYAISQGLKEFFMIVYGFVDEKQVKKEKQKARQLRKTAWWKQRLARGRCYYCGENFSREELTMDHKRPLSRGGTNSRGNVVVCCKPCNSKKKYYTPGEMLMGKISE